MYYGSDPRPRRSELPEPGPLPTDLSRAQVTKHSVASWGKTHPEQHVPAARKGGARGREILQAKRVGELAIHVELPCLPLSGDWYYGYGDAAVPYGGTGDGGSFGQSSRGIQHAARSTQHRSESPYLRKIRCSTIQYIVNGQMQMHRDDRTGSWRVDVVGLDVNTTTDVARRRETFLGFIALAHIFPCRSARDRLHCVCSTCCNVHSGLYSNYRVSVQ